MVSYQEHTTNTQLIDWIKEIEVLCQPEQVYLCDGSQAEYDRFCQELVDQGTFIKLNEEINIGMNVFSFILMV